jgi:flagellar hook assembly protein FlgD
VLSYQLPQAGKVVMSVYDLSGRLVTTLVDGWREAGSHEVTFDGSALASGVYLCRLTAQQYSACQKMVLLK